MTRTFIAGLAALLIACNPLPSSAQSVTPQMRAEAQSLMKTCRADYDRFCNGTRPGGGRVLACLQANSAKLSPACADALPAAADLRTKAVAAGVAPK